MRHRILTVGIDVGLLMTRQAVLVSRGYESLIATPRDVDEKLQSGKFDLVVLSVMLSLEDKLHIQAKLPPGTLTLVLESLVWPSDLLRLVDEALGKKKRVTAWAPSRGPTGSKIAVRRSYDMSVAAIQPLLRCDPEP